MAQAIPKFLDADWNRAVLGAPGGGMSFFSSQAVVLLALGEPKSRASAAAKVPYYRQTEVRRKGLPHRKGRNAP